MHKLLKRQLRKCFGTDQVDSLAQELREFIALVQEAYEQADTDRNLLEHSLELTSQEMMERYRQMLKINQELTKANSLMFGREERIMELKREINALLQSFSQKPRYSNT